MQDVGFHASAAAFVDAWLVIGTDTIKNSSSHTSSSSSTTPLSSNHFSCTSQESMNQTGIKQCKGWDWADGGMPPPRSITQGVGCFPYAGDYKGCNWNGQAIFARAGHRHFPKMRKTVRLANSHDFVGLEETHSSKGRADMLKLPANLTALWSDGSSRQAGIGIMLNRSFLENFNEIDPNLHWIEIEKGRAAMLKLAGKQGTLHIIVVYMDTKSACERKLLMDKISRFIRPKGEALTVMMGDFNFVTTEKDRWCKHNGKWSGGGDAAEETYFNKNLASQHGLYELSQEFFTCDSPLAKSRLDRIYTNQHVSIQLDRMTSCQALDWCNDLSAHRMVSFEKTTPAARGLCGKAIPVFTIRREDWDDKVRAEYFERIRQEGGASEMRKLIFLNDAIRYVSESTWKMKKQENISVEKEDLLGITIACSRALEEGHVEKVKFFCSIYAKLGGMF